VADVAVEAVRGAADLAEGAVVRVVDLAGALVEARAAAAQGAAADLAEVDQGVAAQAVVAPDSVLEPVAVLVLVLALVGDPVVPDGVRVGVQDGVPVGDTIGVPGGVMVGGCRRIGAIPILIMLHLPW
jgi:hypothetical protein